MIEAEDFNLKAAKLGSFLNAEKQEILSDQKRNLLNAQYAAIVSLSTIILERIRVEQEEQRLQKLIEESSNPIPHCG